MSEGSNVWLMSRLDLTGHDASILRACQYKRIRHGTCPAIRCTEYHVQKIQMPFETLVLFDVDGNFTAPVVTPRDGL